MDPMAQETTRMRRTRLSAFFLIVPLLFLTAQARAEFEMPDWLKKSVSDVKAKTSEAVASIRSKVNKDEESPQKISKRNSAVITLKNGNSMSGKIIRQDDKAVVILWQGGEISIDRSEIASIEENAAIKGGQGIMTVEKKDAASGPFENSPVVRLANGQVFDARITAADADKLILKETLKEGGYIENEVQRSKIETLEFRPVTDARSAGIESGLRSRFPKMALYTLGMVTLFTDSQGSAQTVLKQIIRDQMMVNYTEFLDLVKDRRPQGQMFVVVFDKMKDYEEAARADGVPAWLCPGYFSPDSKVLYLSNYYGQEFTDMAYEVVEGGRGEISREVESTRRFTRGERELEIDGIKKEFNMKIESAVGLITTTYTDMTSVTLRHELTHSFLHAYGVQNMAASRLKEGSGGKKYLSDAKTTAEKKEALVSILKSQTESLAGMEIAAANSWYVEGLAEYASTSAYGESNNQRLYELKEARRKNEIWPLEQLTVFKMGSFPGASAEGALSGYAQSWSFCEFLMKNYRKPFMAYLDRMARERPQGQQDVIWLTEALGKDLRAIEKEWYAYIDTLPAVEDVAADMYVRVLQILQT